MIDVKICGQMCAPTEPRSHTGARVEGPARLCLTARTRIGFLCHWLREVNCSLLAGDFGMPLNPGLEATLRFGLEGRLETAVEPVDGGQLRLRVLLAEPAAARIACQAALSSGPDDLVGGLVSLARGEIPPEAAAALREVILPAAPGALERKCTAEMARRLRDCHHPIVLFEEYFADSAEAEAGLPSALAGDLDQLPWRKGEQADLLRTPEETLLELQLPLLDKTRWLVRGETLANCISAVEECGRIVVRHREDVEADTCSHNLQLAFILSEGVRAGGRHPSADDGFLLTHSDRRTQPRKPLAVNLEPVLSAYDFGPSAKEICDSLPESWNDVDVTVTVSLPGEAGAAWFGLPAERSKAHASIFRHLSVPVQAALRRWLRYIYFSEIQRFEQRDIALPVLVYQACRPFYRKTGRDLTYDPISLASFQLALRNSSAAFPNILKGVRRMLLECGMDQTAAHYAPKNAAKILKKMRRVNRQFQNLLAADDLFVGQLVALANRVSDLKRGAANVSAYPSRFLMRQVLDLTKGFHLKLRRLYGGQDWTALAPLIFIEATSALNAILGRAAPVAAILRIGSPDGGAQLVLRGRSRSAAAKSV